MWPASLFIFILVYFSMLNAFLNYLRISYNVIWSYHPFPHLPDPINILIYPTLLSFTYPAPAPLSPACAAHLLLDMKPALFMTVPMCICPVVSRNSCFLQATHHLCLLLSFYPIFYHDSRAMRVGDTHVPFRTVYPKVYSHRPVVGPCVNCHLQQPLSSEFQLQNFILG